MLNELPPAHHYAESYQPTLRVSVGTINRVIMQGESDGKQL